MKTTLLLLTFCLSFVIGRSQTAEDSVKAAVNRLFEAMKTSDAVMLKSAFTDSAILQTIAVDKQGRTIVKTDPVSEFADQVGKMPKGDADERITFDVVRVDANLAIAWTPYKFYYKGNFSHCGVNSFQLVRDNGVWKIQYIIDTRRRKGCE